MSEPDEPLTPGEKQVLYCYGRSLQQLADDHPRWESNRRMFFSWEPSLRLWWISRMELEAQQGLATAETLVSAALAIRMTR